MVGVGETSYIVTINTIKEYMEFIMSESSLLAWADPNWEMQNVCNIFGIDLKIFMYGKETGPLENRQVMIKLNPNEDVYKLSNDRISTRHTIYLYYREHSHYETIIARPHNMGIADKSNGLTRQRSRSEGHNATQEETRQPSVQVSRAM